MSNFGTDEKPISRIMKVLVTTVLLVLCASTARASDEGKKQLVSKLSAATFDFSQALYKKIAEKNENLIYSPYSIHSALSMTSTGAKGDTLSEMREVLETTELGDETNAVYHDLIRQLNNAQNVELNTANAIFVQPGLNLKPLFRLEVSAKYAAKVDEFDYQAVGGPEKVINDYVAEKTGDMIKGILEPNSIDGGTVMLLVNTIFFNGTWKDSFDERRTDKQDFYQLDENVKKVDMMHNEIWVPYRSDKVWKADILALPFKGSRFSLIIVLPHEKEGITKLETSMDTYGAEFFQHLKRKHVRVNIPKFKIETKIELPKVLKEMGMKKAFDPSTADFSGISNGARFYINKVIHQAVIDVKETGTVAAAATIVGITRTAAFWPEITFTADHPFLFFLRDSQTGQVLFRGKFIG